MSDLFKKINVLVKASLNDLLGDEVSTRGRRLNPQRLGKNIDREIAMLRQRINEALDYEDTLATQVQTLQSEVEMLDRQADDAVTQGRDEAARYAIQQMQLAQQRLAMAESDLREHRIVTQELIQRVNELEAAVADAQRAQAAAETQEAEPPSAPAGENVEQTAGGAVADVLREMRERIQAMGDLINAQEEVQGSVSAAEQARSEVAEEVVEDDLARRRNRLSKK